MTTATRFDPTIRPTRTFDASDYLTGDGATDNAAALRELAEEIDAATGDVALYIPAPVMAYHFVSDGVDGTNPTVVTIAKSGLLIYGDGAGSLITWAGVLAEGDLGDVKHTGRQRIFSFTGARILVRDLTIKGQNDPFTAYSNNQSTAIRWNSTDCMVRDVTFKNMVGFPVIDRFAGAGRNHVIRCTFDHCGNGVNLGTNCSIQYRNTFITTEGIEYAGAPGVVALNDVQAGAITVGGNVSSGARKPGTILVGATVKDATSNFAIGTAQAYVDGWLQGNVVEGASQIAMQVGGSTSANYDGNTVVDNYLRSSNTIGLEVVSLASDTVIASNDIRGASIGADVRADDVSLIGNTTDSGGPGTEDIVLQATAQDVVLVGNTGTVDAKTGSTQVEDPVAPTGTEIAINGDVADGFATVQVANWDEDETVSVDASDLETAGLASGDLFEFRHPYNLIDREPYQNGFYKGVDITLRMRAVSPPTDWTVSTTQTLSALGPKFNAFLLRKADRLAVSVKHGNLAAQVWPDPLALIESDGSVIDDSSATSATIGYGSRVDMVDMDSGEWLDGCHWDGNTDRLTFDPGDATNVGLMVSPAPRWPRLGRRATRVRAA